MADRRSRPRGPRDNVNRDPDGDETLSGGSSENMPGRYNTLHRDPDPGPPRPRHSATARSAWRQSWIEPQSRHPPPSGGRQPFEYHGEGYREHHRPIREPQYQTYANYEYQQPYPTPYPPYMPHAPMPPPANPNFPWNYPAPYPPPPNNNGFQSGFHHGGAPLSPNFPPYGHDSRVQEPHSRAQGDPSNWSTTSTVGTSKSSYSMEQELARVQRQLRKVRKENHDAKIREELRADAARQVDAEIMRLRRETSYRGDMASEVGFDMVRVPRTAPPLVNNRQMGHSNDNAVYRPNGDFVGYLF